MIRIPLQSAARFDGTYEGVSRFAAGGPGCTRTAIPQRIVIRNGIAVFDDGRLRAALDGDGRLSVADPSARLSFDGQVDGRAVAGRMTSTIGSPSDQCIRNWLLARVGG